MTEDGIRIDGIERLQQTLLDAIKRGADTAPATKEISAILHDAVEEEFAQEGRAEKWEGLKLSTRAAREKIGKWPGTILQVEGSLAASIHTEHDRYHAVAGTNMPKARTLQFGAKKGQYGKTKHGAPIPFGDIPARPFLRIVPDDIADMEQALVDHIMPK